jgi:hypothetical protein
MSNRSIRRVALVAALAGLAIAAGAVIAVGTLPAADALQDHATQFAGVDSR